jgi:hypothetical protein
MAEVRCDPGLSKRSKTPSTWRLAANRGPRLSRINATGGVRECMCPLPMYSQASVSFWIL